MSLLGEIFDPGIATCETNCQDHDFSTLFPEERKAVQLAVPKRQKEFAAGRYCARAALRTLSYPAIPIPMRADRSPQWPKGVVGSISHCRTRCVAAAALKSTGYLSIGIDIEEAIPLDEDLYASICTPEELAAIQLVPRARRGLVGKAIFSAKECAFKCQFPLTGKMLDFHDIRVDIDWTSRTFEASVASDGLGRLPPGSIAGHIREADGYILTGISLKDN